METTVLVILLAVALAVLRLERSVSEVMTLAALIRSVAP